MNERMKQTRHLASRGFNMRVIQQVIRSGGAANEDDLSETTT
jgi:SOS response regulatory protein OraA/RecX